MDKMAWWEKSAIDNEHTAVSDSFWDVLGYTKEEIGDKREGWLAKVVDEDREKLENAVKNETWELDFRINQKNNTIAWFRETGRWQQVEDGEPKKISAMIRNITVEKKSMERIEGREKENAKIAKEVMELSPIAVALFEIKRTGLSLFDINEKCMELWGFISYQYAVENLARVLNESVPPYQPGGAASVPFVERINTVMRDGQTEFDTYLTLKGESVLLNLNMKKIELPSRTLIVVYMMK